MEIYVLILLMTAIMLFSFVIYLSKKINTVCVKPIVICMILIAIWNITCAAQVLSYTLNSKIMWLSVRRAFIVYIPAFWLMMILELSDKRNFLNRKNIFLVIIPTISAIFLLSSPHHNLYYTRIFLKYVGGYRTITCSFGAWFWVGGIYNYLLNIIGMGILFEALFSKQYARKRQAAVMMAAMIIPIIFDICLLFNFSIEKNLDLTPISFAASLLISIFGILKYGFIDIVPVAREYAFNDMNELMIVTDENKKVIDMNKKALETFNTSIEKVIGTPINNILYEIDDYDFSNTAELSSKINLQYKAEEVIEYYGSINVIKGNSRSVMGYLILLQDVTELTNAQELLKKANEELLDLNKKLYGESIKDGLTEVYNKKHITELLQHEIQNGISEEQLLCVAIFDIDYFKKINDNYGHLTGDSVLKTVAQLIDDEIKGRGIVGRFGGEEFLVLMPNTGLESACELCNDIRCRIHEFQFPDKRINITISAGVSQYGAEDDINSLVKKADDSLYKAKVDGRNRVEAAEEIVKAT